MLLRAMPEEMQAGLARKEAPAEAWEEIQVIRLGGDCIKEANVDKLRRDFDHLQFKQGECVEDFALRATSLTNQLWVLGDKIIDKEVIKKVIHSMLELLQQVAISIETLLDLNSMLIQVATGHLRAVEQRKKKLSGGTKDDQLLLTVEEWMSHLKVWEGESSGGGGHRRGRDRGNRDGNRGGDNNGGD
jgi:hypothetical protein